MVLSSLPEMEHAHRIYTRLGYRRAPARDWDPAPGVHLIAFVKELAMTGTATASPGPSANSRPSAASSSLSRVSLRWDDKPTALAING